MSTVAEETTGLGLKTDAPKAAPNITITAKAADEVRRIIADQAAGEGGVKDKLYLRLRVVGGGCSGFQHKLDLDPTFNEKLDERFEFHGVPVVIDKRSLMYLEGV